MNGVIIYSCLALGGLGILFGIFLGFAARRFAVKVDPRVEKIAGLLPGANCGACGQAGCHAFAELMSEGRISMNSCVSLKEKEAEEIAGLLGITAAKNIKKVAAVHCRGGKKEAKIKFDYNGPYDCRASLLVGNSPKACDYGCIGFGDCMRACPFNAIRINGDGLPVVDIAACTGCGKCVMACPRNIISLVPRQTRIYLGCRSQDRGKAVKEVCSVGCIGCTICARPDITPSGVIRMKGSLPEVDYDKAEDISRAYEKCPTHSYVLRSI